MPERRHFPDVVIPISHIHLSRRFSPAASLVAIFWNLFLVLMIFQIHLKCIAIKCNGRQMVGNDSLRLYLLDLLHPPPLDQGAGLDID